MTIGTKSGLKVIALLTILCGALLYFSAAAYAEDTTIVQEWSGVEAPPPPELKQVTINPADTALLVLDVQNNNCNSKRRPRCVATVPGIKALIAKVRAVGMAVVYSLTSKATLADIRKEVAPQKGEPVVKASVDKFFGTALHEILREREIKTVVIVGTSSNGAVLHTATGASLRRFKVIVPVDGMSASKTYAEQYTAWHLANAPGTRKRTTLTRLGMIDFK